MELSKALRDRDVENVTALLRVTNINAFIENGCAPLHLISNYDLGDENSREIFNFITQHPKININLQNSYNRKSILHLTESVEMVRQLVKIESINLGVQDHKGNTPLMDHLMKLKFVNNRGSYYNNLYICIMLIKNGACVNLGNYEANAPILTLYRFTINSEIIDLFNAIIYHPECNINQQNKNGDTILHLTENSILIKSLLNVATINVNAINRAGVSPLLRNLIKLKNQQHIEQDMEILEICKLLIEHGADVNLCDYEGNAPIHQISKLDLNFTPMMDFYIFLTNHSEININVRNIYGDCLLDLIENPDMLRQCIELPFTPILLLPALRYNDEIIINKIFQRWNQFNYEQLIEIIIENFCDDTYNYKNDGFIILSIWKYISIHKERTSERILKIFFQNVIIYYLYYRLHSYQINVKEYEEFIEFYIKYAEKKFRLRAIQATFLKFRDCKLLRKIIKFANQMELKKFTIKDDLFLYLITNFQCDLTKMLLSIKSTYDNDYFFNLQHVSRFCTLPLHLYENFKTGAYELGEINNTLKKLEEIVFKPKRLIEISRNIARKYVAEKYEIVGPKEMELILNSLEIPPVIREILMLERPIHPQIPLPVVVYF